MKTFALLIAVLAIVPISEMKGQNLIVLTINGDDNGQTVTMDSIMIRNLSKEVDTVLYYPDNSLVLGNVGIQRPLSNDGTFNVDQSYPNPVETSSNIDFQLPDQGFVEVLVYDVLGRTVAGYDDILIAGKHTVTFYPGQDKFYLLTVTWSGYAKTIKIYNPDPCHNPSRIEYRGVQDGYEGYKSFNGGFLEQYEPGDELLIVGYNSPGQSGITDSPEASREYTIQFATNIPCPGLETVTYEGQTYHTIQVFGQCWFKENLNVGTRIMHTQPQTNNDTIEKYCILNNESYCDYFGGLYFWDEMMNYTSQTGGQGICPEGWHVPVDLDWQILEGAVDSDFGIGDPLWENTGWRGSDAGGNLKQAGTSWWEPPNSGATDAFGFTALPAGYFVQNEFWGAGFKTYLWSSEIFDKYMRNLDWEHAEMKKQGGGPEVAISVRCIKDFVED